MKKPFEKSNYHYLMSQLIFTEKSSWEKACILLEMQDELEKLIDQRITKEEIKKEEATNERKSK